MTSVPDRIAHILVRLYPRAWRARYGNELQALLAERGVGWRDVVDLTRGCLSQWVGAVGTPRPETPGAARAVGVAWLAALLVGTVGIWTAAILGDVLRVRIGAPPALWVRVTYVVAAGLPLRCMVALYEPGPGRSFARKIGTAEAANWLTLIFVCVLVQSWAGLGLLAGETHAIIAFMMPLNLVMLVWLSSRHYAWLSVRQMNLQSLRPIVSDSRQRLAQLEHRTRLGLTRADTLARARAEHAAVTEQFDHAAQRLQATVPKHPLGLGLTEPTSSRKARTPELI